MTDKTIEMKFNDLTKLITDSTGVWQDSYVKMALRVSELEKQLVKVNANDIGYIVKEESININLEDTNEYNNASCGLINPPAVLTNWDFASANVTLRQSARFYRWNTISDIDFTNTDVSIVLSIKMIRETVPPQYAEKMGGICLGLVQSPWRKNELTAQEPSKGVCSQILGKNGAGSFVIDDIWLTSAQGTSGTGTTTNELINGIYSQIEIPIRSFPKVKTDATNTFAQQTLHIYFLGTVRPITGLRGIQVAKVSVKVRKKYS